MENSDNEAPNPHYTLLDGAIALHEVYLSYVAAGFTEAQALFLCAEALKGNRT